MNHTNKAQNQHDYGLGFVVCMMMVAAAFVRIYGLGEWDYYHDEIWHVYVASQPTLADVFYTNLTLDGHPFLGYFLWHWLLGIWNDPWMARLPSLVAGILCVPVGYFAGKEMFHSKNGGLFTAFFMAFSCLMIEQSNIVRGYALMMLFVLIALWTVYRYREQGHGGYLVGYFLATAGAFFSEFAVAPIVAFTALHLLYSIANKKQDRISHLLMWGVIHLVLLIYLLGFMLLLRQVGGLDFSQAHFFLKSANQSGLYKFAATIIYYLNFMNEINPLAFHAMTLGSELVGAGSAFILLFALMAGGYQLIHTRQYWQFFHVVLVITIATLFFILDMVPMDRSRRSMGLYIAFIILLYHGLYYLFGRKFLAKTSWLNAKKITVFSTTLFMLLYVGIGENWRALRPIEFQQTKQQTQQAMQFLHTNITKRDVIITDWSSYFHFWNQDRSCRYDPVTKHLMKARCKIADIYFLNGDMRVDNSMLNLAAVQRAYRELSQLSAYKHIGNIWFVGFQHINVKTTLLNPLFGTDLKIKVAERQHHYREELKKIIGEHEEFAHWAYANAGHKRIRYAYECGVEPDTVKIGEENVCLMSLVMLSLDKDVLEKRLLVDYDYQDPSVLLQKIRLENKDKQAAGSQE